MGIYIPFVSLCAVGETPIIQQYQRCVALYLCVALSAQPRGGRHNLVGGRAPLAPVSFYFSLKKRHKATQGVEVLVPKRKKVCRLASQRRCKATHAQNGNGPNTTAV